MAPLVPSQIYSGGGAVFIGDGNAGRDIININHISSVRPLAQSLDGSFFNASDQFKPLQSELAALISMVEAIVGNGFGFDINCNNESALCNLSQNCHGILKDLQELKQRFDSVGTQGQITWEVEQWRAEQLAEIRSKLTTTTSSLNIVYSKSIHSSTRMIMEKLETFLDEVRTGKREGSVVTTHSTDSLSADEKEAWRQLRKELESIGITPALFNQHRELILRGLLKAISDGHLTEDIGDELAETTHEPVEGCLNAADPIYRQGDLVKESGEELFDRTQESTQASLAPADPTYRTTPKTSTQRSKISSANPSAIQPFKGPSRIAKLLFRVTHGRSRLISAAKSGNEGLVQVLLQRETNLDSKDQKGQTPLLWASRNGHEAVVRLLLKTGRVDGDSRDDLYGQTPLLWASRNGHEAVVRLLLEVGKVDADSKDDLYGRTPLSWAARNGHEAVVKLLLETGKVDANSKDDLYSQTPLLWASQNGHEAVVKLLLETGKVDADLEDDLYGRTPLWYASEEGHEAVVRLLSQRPPLPPP